jgi:hypothetical protein
MLVRLIQRYFGFFTLFAGGKGATFCNDLLKLIFQAVTISGVARDDAAPITNIFWSLHTADPGSAGTQTTSEAAYTSYARVAVARTAGGHTVTANSVSPAATISFIAATGGSETETFGMAGTLTSGAGKQLYRGPISPTLVVASGTTPTLTTASAFTET